MWQRLSQRLVTGNLTMSQLQSVRTCYPYHHRLVVVARPQHETIRFPEKIFWGLFIAGTILSVPAWVAVHLGDYRGDKK